MKTFAKQIGLWAPMVAVEILTFIIGIVIALMMAVAGYHLMIYYPAKIIQWVLPVSFLTACLIWVGGYALWVAIEGIREEVEIRRHNKRYVCRV